jgi:hypothetical protein
MILSNISRSYREAINLLYSSFSFDLVRLHTAYRFLSLVPLQRLNQICHLHLQDINTPALYRYPDSPPYERKPSEDEQWSRVCTVLRNMQGLRTLKMHVFKYLGPPLNSQQEEKMMALLAGVPIPKANFVVELPWAAARTSLDETAFK